ncbi:septum formation initiator family protein [Mycobacterium sp. SM1]|uniref:FtsB family cell division protein n=1 Tax=Mycobacterium sp. SM1 TaxID=2816243 RepID=UPI001BCCEF24|nr:septum formation initiator family protein [Mycobacterium sp. SM1]MBS4729186.1 septum formation initiator family protein [Mycobacterium sp. SM1]
MPEAKRTNLKRRSPAPRPGGSADSVGGPPRTPPTKSNRGSPRAQAAPVIDPIKRSVTESAEQRSEQRLGFTARRAAVLAAVACVLTLTITGPVRTYFAQRTEMTQLAATEAALRRQIADLEQQKAKLADPAYIAAQARERLGFVKPGDIPFQVQLPAAAAAPTQPGSGSTPAVSNDPWYTALWHTIADAPHGPASAPQAPLPSPAAVPPSPLSPGG